VACSSPRDERTQFIDGFQAGFVIHTGECFAAVKGFTVTVEGAMVVSFKAGFGGQLAGQQSAGERYARQDTNLAADGFGKEQLGWPLRKILKIICTV